jgi:hypothetical protein
MSPATGLGGDRNDGGGMIERVTSAAICLRRCRIVVETPRMHATDTLLTPSARGPTVAGTVINR